MTFEKRSQVRWNEFGSKYNRLDWTHFQVPFNLSLGSHADQFIPRQLSRVHSWLFLASAPEGEVFPPLSLNETLGVMETLWALPVDGCELIPCTVFSRRVRGGFSDGVFMKCYLVGIFGYLIFRLFFVRKG